MKMKKWMSVLLLLVSCGLVGGLAGYFSSRMPVAQESFRGQTIHIGVPGGTSSTDVEYLNISSTEPYLQFHNTTHEDTDGGRKSILYALGEQSGGEISRLAEIEMSHSGTSDDETGRILVKVNKSNDGDSPSQVASITTAQVEWQPPTDTADWFQILDADGGVPVLSIDTINETIGIGITPSASYKLYVNGNMRLSGSTFVLNNDAVISRSVDDGMLIGLKADNDTANNNMILTTYNNTIKDHDHETPSTHPTFFIHSNTNPDTNNTEWGSLSFQGTGSGGGYLALDTGVGAIKVLTGFVPEHHGSDPCAGAGFPEGAIFWNMSSYIPCYCDHNGDDLKISDDSACF